MYDINTNDSYHGVCFPTVIKASDYFGGVFIKFVISHRFHSTVYGMYVTLSRSPQCRAFHRAVIDEKSLSQLFPIGGGAAVINEIPPMVLDFLEYIRLTSFSKV